MSTNAQPAPQNAIPVSEIDRSCRVPLSVLFASAACWIFLGGLFGMVASLKLHQPNLLADYACWTYGRVTAASSAALWYGFALPCAVGVGLWLLCRLGRLKLVGAGLVTLAAVIWNLGVLIGVVAILGGGSTGFELFEMPGAAAVSLFASWVLFASCGMLTFWRRADRELYPTQWFVAGALFWFVWIYGTACLLLLVAPTRGVLQAAIAGWFAHNLNVVVLGFAGLASIFYFLPKLLGRPLHSYALAAVAFWTLAFFGSWGGIPGSAPLPAWIVSLSTVGTVLTAIPLLAVATNLFLTVRPELQALDKNITLRFSYAALVFWLIAGMQEIVSAFPSVGSLVTFTMFTAAQSQLWLNGFFALAMFGAIYYILPQLLEREWPFPRLIATHFWLFLLGTFISYIALLVGGLAQAILLSDPKTSFVIVMKTTLPALRLDTVGRLLILAGALAFLLNLMTLLVRVLQGNWRRIKTDLTANRGAGE